MNTTTSLTGNTAAMISREVESAILRLTNDDNEFGGYDKAREVLTRFANEVAAIITKHAAALSEENERLKRERDEAIKAHGFVWNAARKAAQYFRWAGCRDTIAIEAMNQCCEAERLTPKWSTDWVIVTPLELTALRQWSEQAREAMGRVHALLMAMPGDDGTSKGQDVWRLWTDACNTAKALLQSHPAATNKTEEGKK